MKQEFDLIVVGAGVFGISTSLFLATHYPQLKFALVEQFRIGHGEGSSHSQSRIIRSIYPVEFYRDLCVEGIENYWPEVEKLLGGKFIEKNSCLSFVEPDESFKEYEQVAASSKGQLQMLSLQEVRKRFPSAPKITIDKPVFLDNRAGVVLAEKYLAAAMNYVRKHQNATILEETQVVEIISREKGVVIHGLQKGTKLELRGKKIALSCGRWITKLVPELNELITGVRQTVSYWEMKRPQEYKIGKFPAWIHYTKSGDNYYGLPDVTGIGIKYALHAHSDSFEKTFKSQQEYLKASVDLLKEKTEYYFKNDYVKVNKIEKCYYSVIKSEDFLIDWRDELENVLICSPCSGHGFKFGPILGKVIADLLVKDESIPVFESNRYRCRLHYHIGINLH